MRTTFTLTASVDDPPCCHPSGDLVVQPAYESGPSNAIAANESAANSIVIVDEIAISDKAKSSLKETQSISPLSVAVDMDAINLFTIRRR